MTVDLNAAEAFLRSTARVLELRRYEAILKGGPTEPVVHALRAYRNGDGGFGHAIEPDMRAPTSQPVGIHTALEILHEVGVRDEEMIGAAADWLTAVTRDDGGIPFVLEDAMAHPHAPWWQYEDASSEIQTPVNAAALHRLGVRHPWLDGADEFCFDRIARLDLSGLTTEAGYALQFGVAFLNAHPDAARAERALDALAPALEPLATAEPDAGAEVASVLDLAPDPDSRSRRLFDRQTIDRHLDAVEAAQQDDGGWRVTWPDWNPAASLEWRGVATVNALRLLHANGRL
jgi:hypothetical protein